MTVVALILAVWVFSLTGSFNMFRSLLRADVNLAVVGVSQALIAALGAILLCAPR